MKVLRNQAGFTIPELLSVMIVSSIFTGLLLFFGINYWRYGYLLEADLDTFISRLNAGDYLRDSIGESSGLIIQNSLADVNTLQPDPAIASGQYWLPVHAIPGNKPVGASGVITPLMYFRRLSVNTTGSVILNGSLPYEDEYMLYLNGATKQLLARTIANPNAPNNRIKSSCPPATATTLCPPDKVVVSNVNSIDMRYFSRTGNTLDYSSVTDPNTGTYNGPDFSVVEVVEVTINIQKKPIFQKTNATQNSTIIRIALRNS